MHVLGVVVGACLAVLAACNTEIVNVGAMACAASTNKAMQAWTLPWYVVVFLTQACHGLGHGSPVRNMAGRQ